MTTTTEHRHVAGWGGVPGECGAECACGVTFDGFDTIAEAADLLDRHIADATHVPAWPGRCWLAVRRCWAWLRQRRTRPQVGSIWQDLNGRQWIAMQYRNDPTDETYIVLAPTDLMGVAPYGDEVDRVDAIEQQYGPLTLISEYAARREESVTEDCHRCRHWTPAQRKWHHCIGCDGTGQVPAQQEESTR